MDSLAVALIWKEFGKPVNLSVLKQKEPVTMLLVMVDSFSLSVRIFTVFGGGVPNCEPRP